MLFPFIDTAPTAIYTLSLHDALPICSFRVVPWNGKGFVADVPRPASDPDAHAARLGRAHRAGDGRARRDRVLLRSEEHTSELQSRENLVCRLLLEKKKQTSKVTTYDQ